MGTSEIPELFGSFPKDSQASCLVLRVPFRSESKCQPELLTFSDQDIGTICQLLLLFLPASSGLLVPVIVRNFQTSPAEEGGVSYVKVWQPLWLKA